MSTSKKTKRAKRPEPAPELVEQPRDVIGELKADIAERNENAERAALETHRKTIDQRRGVIKNYRAELRLLKPALDIVPTITQLVARVRNMGWSDAAPMPFNLGNAVATAEKLLAPNRRGPLQQAVADLLNEKFTEHDLINPAGRYHTWITEAPQVIAAPNALRDLKTLIDSELNQAAEHGLGAGRQTISAYQPPPKQRVVPPMPYIED